jgi:Rrf2 family nitric oxide-sensitive transcriptional repressor
LAREGFIVSVRGRNGGVKLARAAETIRIGDVVRATEVTHVEIEETSRTQRGRGHGVNRVLDDALEAFIEVLDQHTIADMVKSPASALSPRPARATGKTISQRAGLKSAPKTRRTLYDNT